MKIYCECKDWETVALFVGALKKTLPKDFALTLTIKPTLQEGFCVQGVIEDSAGGLKTPTGSEPQPTTSKTPLSAELNFPNKLCCIEYAHSPHYWEEDRPGGRVFFCPGASTDRT